MNEKINAPGPWKKGQSGNPAGRPKGIPNKITEELRGKLFDLLVSNLPKLKKDIAELAPEPRVRLLLRIAEFIIPKPQAINVVMEYRELQKLLEQTPDKYIEKITARIIELNTDNQDNNDNEEN